MPNIDKIYAIKKYNKALFGSREAAADFYDQYVSEFKPSKESSLSKREIKIFYKTGGYKELFKKIVATTVDEIIKDVSFGTTFHFKNRYKRVELGLEPLSIEVLQKKIKSNSLKFDLIKSGYKGYSYCLKTYNKNSNKPRKAINVVIGSYVKMLTDNVNSRRITKIGDKWIKDYYDLICNKFHHIDGKFIKKLLKFSFDLLGFYIGMGIGVLLTGSKVNSYYYIFPTVLNIPNCDIEKGKKLICFGSIALLRKHRKETDLPIVIVFGKDKKKFFNGEPLTEYMVTRTLRLSKIYSTTYFVAPKELEEEIFELIGEGNLENFITHRPITYKELVGDEASKQ